MSSVSSVVKISTLAPELDGHTRPGRHVSSSHRGLLPGHAAADSFQVQANVLRGLNGAPNRLPNE